jgi:undecaprenyl diphosphate synthase
VLGVKPPSIAKNKLPKHVAIVMDGNGRWAREGNLPRTAGHEAGELALLDTVYGALEIGLPVMSVYAFSTENWRRSPDEVRFLMGFNRDVIHRRREELNSLGVRVVWSGQTKRLWKSVVQELEDTEALTRRNKRMTLNMCVNYGGRAELVEAAARLAKDLKSRRLKAGAVTEKTFAKYLSNSDLPDVDLFIRSSGEHRISNFLLWQSAYAEFVFLDVLWPDFDRRHLWQAITEFTQRHRRFGAES